LKLQVCNFRFILDSVSIDMVYVVRKGDRYEHGIGVAQISSRHPA
jgi:hypothetical protein